MPEPSDKRQSLHNCQLYAVATFDVRCNISYAIEKEKSVDENPGCIGDKGFFHFL